VHAVVSTVRPCFFTHGAMTSQYQFPSWLGQYSKAAKGQRLLREIQQHLRLKVSGDKTELMLHYLPVLADKLSKPLDTLEVTKVLIQGINEVISFMDEYYISREDWDSIMELGFQDKVKAIPTKVKTAFTRQ
jgi:replication factor C subunit 1